MSRNVGESAAKALARKLFALLERERLAPRAVFPGSYDCTLYNIVLDNQTPELAQMIVLLHEYAHFILGQCHWGEAIRRLDHLELLTTAYLNRLRSIDIVTAWAAHSPGKVRLENIQSIIFDRNLRESIRKALSQDITFMSGLQFILDIQERKAIMFRQSTLVNEGYAYWACLFAAKEIAAGTEREDQVNELCQQLDITFRRLPKELAKSYHMFCRIEEKLGKNLGAVKNVARLALNSQFCDISLLDLSLSQLRHCLSSDSTSPDRRFHRIYGMIEEGVWPPETALEEQREHLGADGELSRMSIDEFNEYWNNNIDAHVRVTTLMNAFHKRLGLDFYKPMRVDKGSGCDTSPFFPTVEVIDEGTHIGSTENDMANWLVDLFERCHASDERPDSVQMQQGLKMLGLLRNGLLGTAKEEGLI